MKILLLTGPPAVGKNTVASRLAAKRERCAVVDVDVVRWMVVQPHVAPWGGEEGRKQHILGVRNACRLTEQFVEAGYDVVILDLVSDELLTIYRTELRPLEVKTVLLMPTHEEIKRRIISRPVSVSLKPEEIDLLYQWQTLLRTFDEKIDNTSLSAEDVAERLNRGLQ